MAFVMKMLTSIRFWLVVLASPFLLVGCAGLFIDSDPDFVSSDYVARETLTVDLGEPFELSYLRAGDPAGQRVIFVHGTPGDAAGSWHQFLMNVPPGYEFIAIDRPGFGFTRPGKAVVELDRQAAALAPLLETRGGRKTILAGHSLGGPIIAAAAANYPDRVGGLLMLAGSLDPDLEDVLFIQHVGDVPPVRWLLPRVLRNANQELIALEAELRLLAPKLAAITQPTLIVHGTEDKLVPYANVPFMEGTMTGTAHLEVVKLEGTNHFLPWSTEGQILDGIRRMSSVMAGRERRAPLSSAGVDVQ